MKRHGRQVLAVVGSTIALACTAPRVAEAQFPPVAAAAAPNGTSRGGGVNPYVNPSMNPFLNPYYGQFQNSPANAGLFFIAAQQASGGIGSGQLSGVRPSRTATPVAAPAEGPRSNAVPGAGAARYFNRGPQVGAGSDRYYNRYGNYYSKNGH